MKTQAKLFEIISLIIYDYIINIYTYRITIGQIPLKVWHITLSLWKVRETLTLRLG